MAHRGPRMVNLVLALATTVACLFVLFAATAGAVTLPAGFVQTTILPGVAKPQDVGDRAQRACVRGREVRPHQDVRQHRRHHADVVRRPAHEGAQLRRPWASVDRGRPRLPREAVRVRLLHARRSDRRHPAGVWRDQLVRLVRQGHRRSRRELHRRFPDLAAYGRGRHDDRSEQVLVEDYCQQYPAHAGGGLAFGADGNLYASGSDGSTSAFWDYGQTGTPANPCGDPPADRDLLRLRRSEAGACARRTCARPGTRRASTAR